MTHGGQLAATFTGLVIDVAGLTQRKSNVASVRRLLESFETSRPSMP